MFRSTQSECTLYSRIQVHSLFSKDRLRALIYLYLCKCGTLPTRISTRNLINLLEATLFKRYANLICLHLLTICVYAFAMQQNRCFCFILDIKRFRFFPSSQAKMESEKMHFAYSTMCSLT